MGIRFAISKCTDQPTYYSLSEVAADRFTGRYINGCQDQAREIAGMHSLGASRFEQSFT